MSSASRLSAWISAEVAQGFLFAPIWLGLGIVTYFHLPSEPALAALGAAGGGAAVLGAMSWRAGYWLRPLCLALAIFALGFALAGARSVALAAPVLEGRYYGAVEGRVVALDRSAAGALRVTLDQVWLGRRPAWATPKQVRISLYGADAERRPKAGSRIMTTAHLSPPSGPAEPDGFDFQRHAWFQQIGAVGYTRVPVLLAEPAPKGFSFFAWRQLLSERIQSRLEGQSGAFAAALIAGDRSGLTPQTLQDLRRSNLAHLLAISGLHMGLLAGFVFAALRLVLLAVPPLRGGKLGKKLAASGALVAAAAYLGLSGVSVATERAFIMAAVALGAVMLGRRAISLRAVALAAMIVLIRRPEALLGPGFQMSFAATTALVVVFNALGARRAGQPPRPRLWRFASGTVLSSAVAGLATLPIAAAHFNIIAHYGLLANLASVPLMGVMIIPLAVLAVCLMPLGLEALPLAVMGQGLEWILWVAAEVSAWPGAVRMVKSPPGWALFMLLMGLLALGVMASRLRWIGLAPVLGALIFWGVAERPDVLISDTGALVGVATDAGRALSKDKGSGFVARIWLENDGIAASQRRAARLWNAGGQPLMAGQGRVIAAPGKRGLAAFAGCGAFDIAVFSERFEGEAGCIVFDKRRLAESGSVAVFSSASGALNIRTARDVAGRRYWNDRALRRRVLPRQ